MENKIVAGNFKMNLTLDEIKDYINKFNVENENVIICPPFIYLPYFINKKYMVGAQNVAFEDSGAYTGEISPKQIKSMGITYTIVGHSERREIFNETDKIINKKIAKALENDLKVILCIGETLEERKNNLTEEKIQKQLENSLQNISNFDNIIIAYEPIWAIGTGIIPTIDEITSTVNYIKGTIKTLYKLENIKVLYGGSVNDTNVEEINKIKVLDGFLVGGASLDPDKFKKIIEVVVNQ